MTPMCELILYNCATPIWGIFCPHDVSHDVQQVELCARVREETAEISDYAMSLLNVASVCTTQVFCRCKMSLQHDPLCLPTFKTPVSVIEDGGKPGI